MPRQAEPATPFAPTDATSGAMPPGMVSDLQHPENRPALVRILECHILQGRMTVSQEPSGFSMNDSNGIKAGVVHADVGEASGLVQVIDGMLASRVGKRPA